MKNISIIAVLDLGNWSSALLAYLKANPAIPPHLQPYLNYMLDLNYVSILAPSHNIKTGKSGG
jgi:hypothetical protein